MIIKISITFLFSISALVCYSQVDLGIHYQKLTPQLLDTTKENIFIYEVPNAILYFKQQDIIEFINNSQNTFILRNYGSKNLQEALSKKLKQIKIKDILFSYNQIQRDSIFKKDHLDNETQKMNEEFYFIGAGLILNGRFSVFSKEKNNFLTKKLIAKNETGYLGQKVLQFYLPNKKSFYSITTTLGE